LFSDLSTIAVIENIICSYIYALYRNNRAFIYLFATRDTFRNKGIGKTLYNQWEKRALYLEIDEVYAYLIPGNILSEKLFLSSGFSIEKKINLHENQERVLMKKTIGNSFS